MNVDQFRALERWIIAMLRQEPDIAEIITARTAVMQLLEPASSTPFPPAPLHDLETMLLKGMQGASVTLPSANGRSSAILPTMSDDLTTMLTIGIESLRTHGPDIIQILTENEKPDDHARPSSTDGLTM